MSGKSNATIFMAIAAALVVATFFLVASSGLTRNAQAAVVAPPTSEPEDGNITLKVVTAETYVQETGKSAVKAEFDVKDIRIKRGTSQAVDVHIKHLGGENAEKTAIVTLSPPNGYILLPKSVAESTTPEERIQAAQTGQVLPGGIDLGSLVSFIEKGSSDRSSSLTMKLADNTEQVVSMQISIPDDMPAELVGTGFHIPVILNATDTEGNSILAENNGVDVEVTH